ncbi:MAG: CoA transferase [Ardenticatenaceae bacterium]|nr:CoA transferase [Ardenticatenaceae bacterium]
MNQPLSSLKILDFSTLLPGPFATMLLADLGADVLRVEAPGRPDMVRAMPPFDGDTSAWHAVLNRNKRSLALDLKQPGAADVVKRLVAADGGGYDIVLEQFRPGVMERLGIDYATLRAVNPRLIVCAITGFGQTGPYKDHAGHDNNIMALSGIMSYTGHRTCGPVALGVQVADMGGGSFGAIMGILTAVIHRANTGEGQVVDVSMLDMALVWQAHLASQHLVGGETPQREGMPLNGGGVYDYYETRDGRFLSVGSLEPKFWQGFCAAIGRPDLVGPGLQPDWAIQQQVKGEVRAVMKQKTLREWTAVFDPLDVCVEPVLTVPEALQHPQVQARNMVANVPKPDGSTQPQIANPFKFSNAQPQYHHIGAPLGAHTSEILIEIGYNQNDVQRMQDNRIFG